MNPSQDPADPASSPLALSADRQRRLALDLRARLQQDAIDTNTPASDDLHVLMLETLGVLADQLGSIGGELSLPATAAAHAAFDRIADFCAGHGPEFVLVDGSAWIRTDDLASAGAEDAVYSLDTASGALRFGDGVHGRRPAEGARIVLAYRYGTGESGKLSSGAYDASLVPLRRPRFFTGQLLRAEDFTLEQEYQRAKQHLLNRRLHGWGIVEGLEVGIAGAEAVVSAGLALDPTGREIIVDRESHILLGLSKKKKAELSVRYVERETDPVPSLGGEDGFDYSRVVEEYELALDSKDPARVPLGMLVRRGGRWRLDRKFKRRRVR